MINKAIIVGNLGKDVELRYTSTGTAVASFSVATSERYKDKAGNAQEKTEWHNIVAWGQLAEICGKYLAKGSKVYVEGKIQTRSYDDRDGNKRYITEINISEMKMLGDKKEGGDAAPRREAQPAPDAPDQGGYSPDDDIPF
jgi:single-strand DNA-binding protein